MKLYFTKSRIYLCFRVNYSHREVQNSLASLEFPGINYLITPFSYPSSGRRALFRRPIYTYQICKFIVLIIR